MIDKPIVYQSEDGKTLFIDTAYGSSDIEIVTDKNGLRVTFDNEACSTDPLTKNDIKEIIHFLMSHL